MILFPIPLLELSLSAGESLLELSLSARECDTMLPVHLSF
jgi:hypothetical protein